MKKFKRFFFISLVIFILIPVIRAQSYTNTSFSLTFNNSPREPSDVPVLPLLSTDKEYFQGGMITKPASDDDYQAFGNGAFSKMNGKTEMKHLITSGAWWLWVGDKPRVRLSGRSTGGAYAKPGLLPHLGVSCEISIQIGSGGKKKPLEDFTSIKTIFSPGEAEWQCGDDDFPVSVKLNAIPFIEEYGCALILQVESTQAQEIELEWHISDADHVRDLKDYSEFSNENGGTYKWTRIYAGSKGNNAETENGVIKRVLQGIPGKVNADTLVCVWGYKDYEQSEVDKAYKRLRFRPFPSREWTEEMKKKWYHHWIGRGLHPEEKFLAAFKDPASRIKESRDFWGSLREKVTIKTGDQRFDNMIQALGARGISCYEYPAFLHAANYMKYGKINCGYYGYEAAGYHDEVESSLKFITGSQCVKGRQRYIMPNFRISQWAEEMNPYFIEQVWYHYLWTGDEEFLNDMWPSVRRALEHLIITSDPEHDGIFTGFYENWNGDGKSRGGKCSLWTAMGITALRCGYEMASLMEDVDWTYPGQQNPNPPADNDFSRRYKRLLDRAEAAYETLFNPEIGAYSSGEWNGELRNTPSNEEMNYAIWRGAGSMLRNYASMRFIKDHYHVNAANGIVEYCNKDWPVQWSNHYASLADAMSSIASAAAVNDMDSYWPVLKTASETAYTRPECTVRPSDGTGNSNVLYGLEIEQMVLMAVLDNIFGIKPRLGENLIVIRPSFPGEWDNPGISLPDVSYQYEKGDDFISLKVRTPVPRIIRAELPVTRTVKNVLANGKEVHYDTRKEVNVCRVIVNTEAAREHEIHIALDKNHPSVTGRTDCIINKTCVFNVKNAEIIGVQNPQIHFGPIEFNSQKVEISPEITGRYTVFLELRKDNVSWYHPLELTVSKPWAIQENYQAWTLEQPACQLSPGIDNTKKSLHFKIKNNNDHKVSGDLEVEIHGKPVKKSFSAGANQVKPVEISLEKVWEQLSPGTTRFKVKFNGHEQEAFAVNWELAGTHLDKKSLSSLDLRPYNNINIRKLYGYDFTWRTDYTGAAVGADWRDTLTIDEKGYRIFVPPVSVMNFGVLPEHNPIWTAWILPEWPEKWDIPVDFPFFEKRLDAKDILALINTENNASIPPEAIIKLETPVSVEKIYLLTANLTKTCKSYYPGAEVIVKYESGDNQVIQLVPPYTMSSFNQPFCVRDLNIPFGKLHWTATMVEYGANTGLSLSDLELDPERKVKQISLRCVSSETVFGVLGMSLLKSPMN